jgi:hypothetical protein
MVDRDDNSGPGGAGGADAEPRIPAISPDMTAESSSSTDSSRSVDLPSSTDSSLSVDLHAPITSTASAHRPSALATTEAPADEEPADYVPARVGCRTDLRGWAGAHLHGAVRPRRRAAGRGRPPGRWC